MLLYTSIPQQMRHTLNVLLHYIHLTAIVTLQILIINTKYNQQMY